MDTIEVSGIVIAFERRGTGPPLLLIHGLLQDSRAWRPQLDALSDDFTVVAWDAPGCGRSSDPPETFRLPEYADCLAEFVDALGLEQPNVLGLSFGAVLALELYRGHPQIPRTLVLASAYAGWAGSLSAEVVVGRLEQALREANLPAHQFVPGWIPGLLTESAPTELVDGVVAMMSEFHPAGYRAMARGLAEADLRDVLSDLRETRSVAMKDATLRRTHATRPFRRTRVKDKGGRRLNASRVPTGGGRAERTKAPPCDRSKSCSLRTFPPCRILTGRSEKSRSS